MIDIGVNAASKKFKDSGYTLDHIFQYAYESGITEIIVISNSLKEFNENLYIVKKEYPIKVRITIGVHPHNASSVSSEKQLTSFIENNLKDSVAIGECGLDYDRKFSPKEKQIEVFKYHINIAKKYGVPLYLHERDAHEDFVSIIKEMDYFNGVVHCFTGSYEKLMTYLSLGLYIGITGWICDTRRNQDLYKALKNVPKDLLLSRIMFETDAPYLKPPEYNQKINYPDSLHHVITKVSKILGVPFDELVKISTQNVKRLFH
jgi:TatD DNase family protein